MDIDLLVVCDQLDVVTRRYPTDYNAQIDSRAVRCLHLMLLLVLLRLYWLVLVALGPSILHVGLLI